MPPERLGPLFEAFRPWLAAKSERRLGFIWHGGEPMLPGLDFYRRAAADQARVFERDTGRVANRIQSNLTLLTPEWVEFLKTFVRSIGTSYDPVEGVRGLKSGEPLAARWVRAIEACRRAGIPVGVVYVVHRLSLPKVRDIYLFFRNLLPRGRVRFNPLYREGRAAEDLADDLAVTAGEYGRFLVDVARLWWDDGRRHAVLPIREWHDAWNGAGGRLSCDSQGSCQETLLGVAPDGSAWGCGRFADRGEARWCLGNVFEDDIEAILSHPARTALADRRERLRREACRDCGYWGVCHGGCPMMAEITYGDALRETPFCTARKTVFGFLEDRLGPPAVTAPHDGGASAEAAP